MFHGCVRNFRQSLGLGMADLLPISIADGSWHIFFENWRSQCERCNDDIENFSPEILKELRNLADLSHKSAGVFTLLEGSEHLCVLQVNTAHLPGYDGAVLRVRLLTWCPLFDFGTMSIGEFGSALGDVFLGVMQLSTSGKYRADHVKFHFRSPADREFFTNLKPGLEKIGGIKTVQIRGAWLYITKSQEAQGLLEGETG